MALGTPVAGTLAENASAATSIAVPYPTGISAGDLLLLWVAVSSSTSPTNPAGWTSIVNGASGTGSQSPAGRWSRKIATGSESGNQNVTTPNVVSRGQMWRISGADATTPIDVVGTHTPSAIGGAVTHPGVTTTMVDTQVWATVIRNLSGGTQNQITDPFTMTVALNDSSPTPSSQVSYIDWSGSGATGTITFGVSTIARQAFDVFAVRPAVTAPPSGSASGTLAWAGSASGTTVRQGSATGSLAWSGAADGSTTRSGSAVGVLAWAGVAAGARSPEGAASGSLAWTGTAVGTTDREGVATGTLAWAGAAVGETPAMDDASGSATGTLAWSGTATGKRNPIATATGSVTWSGAAVGERTPKGAATGTAAWTGTAAGTTVREGVAVGVTTWAGAAVGRVVKSGVATGTTAWAGVAYGAAPSLLPSEGGGAGTLTWNGTATGASARAGAATGTVAWVGAATGAIVTTGTGAGLTAWSGLAVGVTPAIGRDITVTTSAISGAIYVTGLNGNTTTGTAPVPAPVTSVAVLDQRTTALTGRHFTSTPPTT